MYINFKTDLSISVVSIVLMMVLFSCTIEVSFTQKEPEARLVVNGLIEPDSLIRLRISSTVSILEEKAPLIEDAIVHLSIDGSYVETLQYQGEGMYASATGAVPGRIYAIEVSAPGYPGASAKDTLPTAVPILEASSELGNTYDEYGDPHTDVEMVFRDPPGTDFYEFMFLDAHYIRKDTNTYTASYQSPVFIADPALKTDSELEYEPITFVFSDEMFEGQKYRMVNKFISMVVSHTNTRPVIPEADLRKSYVVLRHVSHAYYQYRKSWIRHSNNQQTGHFADDPLYVLNVGSPKPMYTNIEGGYGIFAAYNTSWYSLDRH